jgi:hypothetical protein
MEGRISVYPGFTGGLSLQYQGLSGSLFRYHLLPDSPLIDRGLCYEHRTQAQVAPYDDIDGEVRPMGAGCEIGADEIRWCKSKCVKSGRL